MKTLTKLSIIFLFAACGKSPQELAILEHEQTNGATKTDLQMEILSLKKVKDIIAKDSINILLNEAFPKNPTMQTLLDYKDFNNKMHVEYDSLRKIESEKGDDQNYGLTALYAKTIIEYEEKKQITDSLFTLINKYQSQPEKVVASIWECKYKIKNPFLNNAEQETSKRYVFNSRNEIVGIK